MLTLTRGFLAAVAVSALFAGPALSQATDPAQSCADYLKVVATTGGTPKSGDAAVDKMAADIDAKMKTYCTANPNVKAMDAAMKIMGG